MKRPIDRPPGDAYRASVKEGQRAARVCRRAWELHRARERKRRAKAEQRLALDCAAMVRVARRFIARLGHCTEDDLFAAGFAHKLVAKHGPAAIKTAEKKGNGT